MRGLLSARLVSVVLFLSALLMTFASSGAERFELHDCDLAGLTTPAKCGTYEVFENRKTMAGRKIPLHVVVLPATGENPEPDPIVFFAGGPGGSTVDMAPGLANFRSHDRIKRDFLLIDYRGTGQSKPLTCPYQEERNQGIAEALETFLPVDLLDECRDALSADADLTQYTTPNIVDDAAEVATALGYDKLNLSGGSYGSRAVLVFMRRHPRRVRSAVIEGVVPTNTRVPVTFAADAQAALSGWFRECAEDRDCATRFPNLSNDLDQVLGELENGAKTLTVTDPKTRRAVELQLSRNAFVQTLRYLLYSSAGALKIPAYIHAAANGEWQPMADAAYTIGGFLMASMPDGLYLSVTCGEDVVHIGPNAAAIQSGFMGDFRLSQQMAACEKWPKSSLPAEFYQPIQSTAPVLIISGERDPVTPARWGYQAQEFLSNSLHIVVPDGGHSWFGLNQTECLDAIHSRLLDTASITELDATTCVDEIRRPAFMLEIPRDKEIEMTSAQLKAFIGTYAAEGGGFQLVVELHGDDLMTTIGKNQMRLIPVGEQRFKIEGNPPGDYFDFIVTDDQARAIEIIRNGSAQEKLNKIMQ